MAGRIKHMQRSRAGRDRRGIYRKYVIGKSNIYDAGDYSILHKLSSLFKHQSR